MEDSLKSDTDFPARILESIAYSLNIPEYKNPHSNLFENEHKVSFLSHFFGECLKSMTEDNSYFGNPVWHQCFAS